MWDNLDNFTILENYMVEKVAKYLRKSRDEEQKEKKHNLDIMHEQRELMDRVLNVYELPSDPFEEIKSGKTIEDRPKIKKIIKGVRAGIYQAIAVKDLSRLGRGDEQDMNTITELMDDYDLVIITPNKIYDPKNSTDRQQVRFEMFLYREEYHMINRRLQDQRRNNARQGMWQTGKKPYGYEIDKISRKLAIVEEEAKAIREIYHLYAYGKKGRDYGCRAIVTELKNLNLKSPKGNDYWTTTQVERTLQNPAYRGHVIYGLRKRQKDKKIVLNNPTNVIFKENAHPPLVDEITAIKVDKKMYEIKKKQKRTPRVKFGAKLYELSGLIKCSKCGKVLNTQKCNKVYKWKSDESKQTVSEQFFLRCQTPSCQMVKYDLVESTINQMLDKLSELDNTYLNIKLKEAIDNSEKEPSFDNEEIKESLEKELADIKRRIDKVYELIEDGFYEPHEKDQRLEKHLIKKKEVEKELEKINNHSKNLYKQTNINSLKTQIKSIVELYNELKENNNKQSQNKLLREILQYVELTVIEKATKKLEAVIQLNFIFRSDFLLNGIEKEIKNIKGTL